MKACALVGLHRMAEANAVRSDSDSSPDVGDVWRYCCPKKIRSGVTTASKGKEVRVLLWSMTSTMSITSPIEVVGQD